MCDEVFIIYGNTQCVGLWDVELFTKREEAEKQFREYIDEYNATVSEKNNCSVAVIESGDIGKFILERRSLKDV